MDQHLWQHGTALDNAAFSSQIAFQHGNTAGGRVGILYRADDGRVSVDGGGDVLAQSLAGDGHAGGVQQIPLGKFLQHSVNAAGFI